MPGLINCHVHLANDGSPDLFGQAGRDSVTIAALRGYKNLQLTLESGVTSVRDCGAASGIAIDLARAVDEGLVTGPRIRAAGRVITMTGGHGHFIGREADGPDGVRPGHPGGDQGRRPLHQGHGHRRRAHARRDPDPDRPAAGRARAGRPGGAQRRPPHGLPRHRQRGDQERHPGRHRLHRARLLPGRRGPAARPGPRNDPGARRSSRSTRSSNNGKTGGDPDLGGGEGRERVRPSPGELRRRRPLRHEDRRRDGRGHPVQPARLTWPRSSR